jgi:signal transduction histidine kinase
MPEKVEAAIKASPPHTARRQKIEGTPKASNEQSELNRRARLLNGLIWALIGALGIFLVYVLTTGMQSWISGIISFGAALVVSGIGYWLARSGRFYAAVYLFLSGFVVLLLFIVFMGGETAFTVSEEAGLGWGVVATAIMISFVLACMAWLFGESINNAFSTIKKRSEELQATKEELRSSNEELKAAHNKLLETQEQLIRSEKLAAIGQLASGVGHELRNPLGAIKNASFYIKRRITNTDLPNTEPRVMEFLGIIEEEVNSANKVITDLLGFSRVAKPTVAPANIAGIIEDALRYTPLPGNVELIKEINNNLPMVMVDGDQIKQVFVNITLNALQAMTEGGRLEIRASDKGKFIDVEFSDTGIGIPDSVKKKIFDPLFTTKAKGVGLGLSVCKTIIEHHEGDIKVQSKVGEGTTFTISLPTQKILETSLITKVGNDGQAQCLSS